MHQLSPKAENISIHALLAESDRPAFFDTAQHTYFYPRSPCGERRSARPETRRRDVISIHALLAESDSWQTCATDQQPNFYPRSPCGERQPDGTITDTFFGISIHALLAESDDNGHETTLDRVSISIHALLAESDTTLTHTAYTAPHFYPRSPCGERQTSSQ